MKNEYFQNDVIDLRILGDIGPVCIYRFPVRYHLPRDNLQYPTLPYSITVIYIYIYIILF